MNYRKFGKLLAGAAGDLGLLLLPVPNVGWLRAVKYAASLAKFASTYGALGALRKNGLFDLCEIHPLLRLHLDMAKIQAQSVPLFVTACGEPRATRPLGPARWFNIQNQTEEEAWNLIAASMSVPFFFSPVQVRGEYYSDGGAGYWLPIEPLYEYGIRNMIVVSTKAGTTCNTSRFPNSNIIFIKPHKSLGRFPVATFRFTEAAVKRWMDQGYEDALRVLDRQGRPASQCC
jgi:predicted patatin/cPLA2 family phospholipase